MSGEDFTAGLERGRRALWVDRDVIAKLEAVTALVVRAVDGCDRAGISMEVHGAPRSLAVTDEVVIEVDLVQYDTGEGPCLASIRDSAIVRIDVTEAEDRWQHFAAGALAAGVQSVLSVPLLV